MISVIIPFYNEADSLPVLLKELAPVLAAVKEDYELILVDDGSDDQVKLNIVPSPLTGKTKLIRQRRRFGKGQALQTGINHSRGDTIVFMDADLQDDPHDLPRFLKQLDQGDDFVNGSRKIRQDNAVIKLYSRVANWLLQRILHSPFSDINCGYKAFRRVVFEETVFYANNFRFFPLVVSNRGFRVGEISVNNRVRQFGRSKFGQGKVLIGVFDTLTAYFIFRFSEAPLHFFGPIGGVIGLGGLIITGYLLVERLFFGALLYRRPLLQIGVLLIIVGIQIVMTGMIGELIVYLNKKHANL